MSKIKSRLPLIVYFLIVLVMICFLSLLVGPAKIPASKVFISVLRPSDSNASSIIWQIRMPRLALGLLVGTLLGTAGSIFLGIFGSSIVDNKVVKGFYTVALLAAAAGVLLMASGISLPSEYMALLGSLSRQGWGRAFTMLLFVIFGILTYIFYYKDLNALLFGTYTAKTLGVEVKMVTVILFLAGFILAGAAIYSSGMMVLAALIMPYFVRLATGVNYKYLIPVSIISTASLLVLMDIFTRIVFPIELPIGVIMVLVGAPFYLYALQRRRLGL